MCYLLHVDAVACAAEDQARFHGLCEAARLGFVVSVWRFGSGLGVVGSLGLRSPPAPLAGSSRNGRTWCPPETGLRSC